VRIGFHSGPVIQRDNDVFGDTVNLAARLVDQAQKGQIVTSHQTVQQLSPAAARVLAQAVLDHDQGQGRQGELCELEWRPVSDAINDPGPRPEARSAAAALRLSYRDLRLVRRRQNDSIVIGRDASCGLVIASQNVSPLHCTIERRHDSSCSRNHSTNGTFVTVEATAILLRREAMPLGTHGCLALGEACAETAEVVAYFLD